MNSSRGVFITSILSVLVLAAAYFGSQKMSEAKAPPPKNKSTIESVKVVDVLKVTNQPVRNEIALYGRLSAFKKIDLFSEVGGKLVSLNKPFKKGIRFEQGEVLFSIENTVQKYNLQAQKSALVNAITALLPDLNIDYPESFAPWKNYVETFDNNKPIPNFPTAITDREKLFISGKNLHNQYFSIRAAEEQLKKYTVVAPFSGVLTDAVITEGAIISPGQRLGQLMNTGMYELEAPITLADLKYLKIGSQVQLTSSSVQGSWNGQIVRISDQIDQQTQAVVVFIRVSGNNLREGMYLKGFVKGKSLTDGQEIPISAMTDDGGVYLVMDSVLQHQLVEPVRTFANTVVVNGLTEGALILAQKLPAAHDGMKVKVGKITNE